MKKTITRLGQALLVAALVALVPLFGFAQQITVNRVYDFSGNTDTLSSQINYVYADSSRIIALGEAHPEGQKPYAFTAAFDYSGNLLWQKPIRLPGNLFVARDTGYQNLIKAAPDVYIAAGNIQNAPKEGNDTGIEPFLYFFNAAGDSLRLLRLYDSAMDHYLSALAVDSQGNIIVCGDNHELELGHYPIRTRGYWFEKRDNSGALLHHFQFPLFSINAGSFYGGPIPSRITSVLPVSINDSIRYIVAANTEFPESGLVLNLDSAFQPVVEVLRFVGGPPLFPADYSALPTLMHHFEFNFIPRKGHPNSYFWSFPVRYYGDSDPMHDYASTLNGIYFCRTNIVPKSNYYDCHLDWYHAFLVNDTLMPKYSQADYDVQDRSELEQAVNGDLLVQKEVWRPSDTLYPYGGNKFSSFPVLFRANDTGHLKWGMHFQHIASTDSGIYHGFHDLSVAPDGRIVMAGYLRSRYPVPGYDTVGKVSWLVVLSDTLHDRQPQPPEEPEGIALTAAGPKAKVLVYPNPAGNHTSIELQSFRGSLSDVTWQLCDMDGRVLEGHSFSSLKTAVPLSGLGSGVYFIKVWYRGKQAGSVKILKK